MLATAFGRLHCQGLPLPSGEVKENWKEHPNAKPQGPDSQGRGDFTDASEPREAKPVPSEAHFEARLKNRENDVVRAWCDYVQWTADRGEDELNVLQRACYALAGDERHRDDIRHLRLWIRHAAHIGEAEKVFDFLAAEGIGVRHALLYEAWASHLERQRQFEAAERQYQLGLQREAEPLERLRSRYHEFQRRMCKRAARQEGREAKGKEEVSEPKALSAVAAPVTAAASPVAGFTVHEDTVLQIEDEMELPVHDQLFIPVPGQRLALDELELPGKQMLLPQKASSFVDDAHGAPVPKVLARIASSAEWRVPTSAQSGRRRSSQASGKSESHSSLLPSGNVTTEFTGGLRAMLGHWSVQSGRHQDSAGVSTESSEPADPDPTYTAEWAQRDVLALFGTDAASRASRASRGLRCDTSPKRRTSSAFEIFEEF